MDPAEQLQAAGSDRQGMRDETVQTTAAPQPEDVLAEEVAYHNIDASIPLTGESLSAVSDVSFAGSLQGRPAFAQSSFLAAVQTAMQSESATPAGGGDQKTVVVPHYFINLPVAIKFEPQSGGGAKIVFQDRGEIPYVFPIELVYAFPLIIFFLYTLIWCLCCRRSNRSGLSFRLICEAAACFMCLWADLATKHKVISSGRAWSYVIAMMLLLSSWNIAELVVKDNEATNTLVFWTFQGIVAFVWIAYSIERMYVRKFYRRSADPMAAAHPMADCVAVACCGQFTALQEAQLMSNTQQDQSSAKAHW